MVMVDLMMYKVTAKKKLKQTKMAFFYLMKQIRMYL